MKLQDYDNYLSKTIKKYNCVRFQDCFEEGDLKKSVHTKGNLCLLRHDIDFSPQNALAMAITENKKEIRSTYTVLFGDEYYNPLEKKNRHILFKILDLGHEIGLHFDPTVYQIENENDLGKWISLEKRMLEDVLHSSITMFSFHDTTPFSMSCKAPMYAGLTNAYGEFFQTNIDYTSDSYGYWRYRTWDELLDDNAPIIQILTHPIWWPRDSKLEPFETVVRESYLRFLDQINKYVRVFSGQETGENRSFLKEQIDDIKDMNNPDLLMQYALVSKLINSLLDDSIPEAKRREITIAFLEGWPS